MQFTDILCFSSTHRVKCYVWFCDYDELFVLNFKSFIKSAACTGVAFDLY